MDRNELTQNIKEQRPTLTPNSLKAYTSMLWNLNKQLDKTKTLFYLDDFNDVNKVVNYLEGKEKKNISTFKTILSALYVLTGIVEYKTLLLEKNKEYNDAKAKNEMTPKLQEQSISKNEIETINKALEKEANYIYKKKTPLTEGDRQNIMNYVIMEFMSGKHMNPIRPMNVTEIKIKNINKETDNWIDFRNKKIIYNVYKGSNTKGQDKQDLPAGLAKVLKKWIKINPTEYLVYNIYLHKLTSTTLYDRLKKITGTNNNAFRHAFISGKYQSLIELKPMNEELAKDMKKMGSSIASADSYLQKLP